MKSNMKIAVIGGGPGGLYFARLIRRKWPNWRVDVFEQNSPDATFGFGVTLGGTSLGRLGDEDPEFVKGLADIAVFADHQVFDLNGEKLVVEYSQKGASVERLAMLTLLKKLCEAVGVNIHYQHHVASVDDVGDYDLIVASDGANSKIRTDRQDAFAVEGKLLNNRFAWYGVDRALGSSALVFRSAMGGALIAHYYAYTSSMSTFVAECDEAAWVKGGFEFMNDDDRRSVFERIFAPELNGGRLIDNRSIYRQFPAIAATNWVHQNIVLIGDAQRVAHFSIGSGTRLALDDAHALFEAINDAPDLTAALALFQQRRRPIRMRFADAAMRSYEWYERVGEAMKQPLLEFVYDFMTRTGRIDDERLKSYAPGFARLYTEYRDQKETAL
jgi:2-polyprenyl-6-methoxyphenol hydroxylase-like FAD-dependent oxidoreductase